MVSVLTHMPRVLASYLRDGEDGLSRVTDGLEDAAHERGAKFHKRRALYLPVSPFPPVLWRPKCGRCRFWVEGEPGAPGGCRIVGRPGDSFGGEAIHPDGFCGFYTPPAGEPPFAWFHDQLAPTGTDSVRGEYDHPLDPSDAEAASDGADEERQVVGRPEGGRADGGR